MERRLTSGVFFLNSRLCSMSRFLDCSLSSCRFANTVAVASSSLCQEKQKGKTRLKLHFIQRRSYLHLTRTLGRAPAPQELPTHQGLSTHRQRLQWKAVSGGAVDRETGTITWSPSSRMHWFEEIKLTQL